MDADVVGGRGDVDLHVLLAAQVDAQAGQRPLERREHAPGREGAVPVSGPEEPRRVEARHLVEAKPKPQLEQSLQRALVEALGRGQERAGLRGQVVEREAEAPV